MKNQDQKLSNKKLNIFLWIAQIFLSMVFVLTGAMKITQPIANLASMMDWVNHVSPVLVRFVGIAELLGAIGLLLPSILHVKPNLTIWASVGLILVMIPATFYHISIGESNMIVIPLVLAAISAFIAWGRSKKEPIANSNLYEV
jgi:uncharacterized membrane protein YphA (DoxX/SURF4 family)